MGKKRHCDSRLQISLSPYQAQAVSKYLCNEGF